MTELGKHVVFFANYENYLCHFLRMFEAKTRKYFKGAHNHFLVPATKVPRRYNWSLAWNYSYYLACLQLGVNAKLVLGLP